MNKILDIPLLLLVIIVCVSCEKDNDYPKRYVLETYKSEALKAFTKTSEITDENVIERFISGYEAYFWEEGENQDGWDVEIEFTSEYKGKITSSVDVLNFNLIRKNGILYFQLTDTLFSYSPLENERLIYSPLYQIPAPYPSQAIAYIPCFYAVETKAGLYIPTVSYLEKVYSSNSELLSNQAIANYNNMFDANYLHKVENSNFIDTIVYQDNKVIFSLK